ncbi:MAG: thioredoxin-disulfide reductase [Deltaproteobacteria bacterium]|nr:MAG: thioredoxin-disulfide reductase [Deltaproteobacteria bacterium]
MEYDVIIIGAGPAGLTAGIYLARAGKKVLCLEQGRVGGQISIAGHVDNYPGFPAGTTGADLVALFEEQAKRFGLTVQMGRVDGMKIDGNIKEVSVSGFPLRAKVVIVATGLVQKLGIPGEEELLGKGVSYCATCDGALFRGRPVAVIGTAEWVVEEATFVASYASKLYMIAKGPKFEPTTESRKELLSFEGVEAITGATPLEVTGDNRGVTGLRLSVGGEERSIEVDGVFVLSGKKRPGTEFLKGLVDLTKEGYIEVGENCESSIPGIYGIGDVCRSEFHQVATAVGDGAIAGMDAIRYLKGN